MGYDTLDLWGGENASPACVDGSSQQRCAYWELAHEETARQDADLGFSKTDHATRRLLSNSPAVSRVAKSRYQGKMAS
jgi:hypothetical protein